MRSLEIIWDFRDHRSHAFPELEAGACILDDVGRCHYIFQRASSPIRIVEAVKQFSRFELPQKKEPGDVLSLFVAPFPPRKTIFPDLAIENIPSGCKRSKIKICVARNGFSFGTEVKLGPSRLGAESGDEYDGTLNVGCVGHGRCRANIYGARRIGHNDRKVVTPFNSKLLSVQQRLSKSSQSVRTGGLPRAHIALLNMHDQLEEK
ncbi:hypothetical protein EPUS_06370 [Endocarpon pusillum Z07020]|uniref:Uncharacterized protein n=1 Tax=Endocarpon pusillum (strain Z07020 / HMAS-L-300199) TaxID=1263415 RepID=U1GQ60_ENDPU|nr:uncharacterized protein EPUS_06370 [Endocarpon pusillum Z07020]ERF74101.1 hypothetical protein EPUS_06370 [Endocarpon pusillum Z07020]